MELDVFLIVCPLVFIGSFVDAVAGGGGLITLPAYLLAGVPPHVAIATNKLSSDIGMTVSTWRLFTNGFINLKLAVIPVTAAIVGSWIGARLALLMPAEIFQIILVCCLPVVALLIFRKKTLGAHTLPMPPTLRRWILGLSGGICGIYDGFYGPGSGTFLLLSFTAWAKLGIREAAGQMRIVNYCSGLGALATFAMAGEVYWLLGAVAGCFGIAGHYIGSGLVLNNGDKIVRPIILLVLFGLFIKTAWDLLA